MKLSFMTFLCPDWKVGKIIKAAKRYGYHGVEIRAGVNHKHAIELTTTRSEKRKIKQMFSESGVEISCLATSLQFALEDKKERRKSIITLKRYIDLASDIGAPYIRVFGGFPSQKINLHGVIAYTADSLREAADYALGRDTEILLETHDYFCSSYRVAAVLKEANHSKLSALWDVMHPFNQLEPFRETYAHLKPYIKHLHIHDGRFTKGKVSMIICPLGKGVIDHRIPLGFLIKSRFRGYFSVEVFLKKGAESPKWLSQYAKKFREYEREINA
ncbi:sugar phosphate isomerase/epimerase [candidate division NPL-UPA2 bacterium]|nr:sugar phosphate isomerase/epimerase [candidate division NPL-UPA2 bacterium]